MFLVYERGMTSPPAPAPEAPLPATQNQLRASPAFGAMSDDVTPGASGASEAPEAPERRKRQKIAVACDTCRARKVKCDGIRPGQCFMTYLYHVIYSTVYLNTDTDLERSLWSVCKEEGQDCWMQIFRREAERNMAPE